MPIANVIHLMISSGSCCASMRLVTCPVDGRVGIGLLVAWLSSERERSDGLWTSTWQRAAQNGDKFGRVRDTTPFGSETTGWCPTGRGGASEAAAGAGLRGVLRSLRLRGS